MGFLEDMDKDLDEVFMNSEEFSTTHEFDGKPITCVVDDDLNAQNKQKTVDGLYKGVKTFHVSAKQLEGKPAIDGRFSFDGEFYYITDCLDNAGMYTITLSKNKES